MSETTEAVATESAAPAEQVTEAAAVVESNPGPSTETAAEVSTEEAAPAPAAETYDYVPKKFLDPEGKPDFKKLAESYTGLEKKLGAKGNIPPADVSEYEFDFGDRPIDEEASVAFKDEALKAGLTKEQYKFVVGKYAGIVDQLQWSPDRSEKVLKEEWGDDYAANGKRAAAAFNEFLPSDVDPHDPVWNHPAVVKLLARAGMELGEDVIAKAGAPSGGPDIHEQIKELMDKPEYWKSQKLQEQAAALWAKVK